VIGGQLRNFRIFLIATPKIGWRLEIIHLAPLVPLVCLFTNIAWYDNNLSFNFFIFYHMKTMCCIIISSQTEFMLVIFLYNFVLLLGTKDGSSAKIFEII
jgi:hypothetical protein